ncbi:SREBP regulating gene protein-like [Gigantopelta aegis]|uniref:SREBP regulating gene protein-like n=1 Tax=Gigantopelta aegis TaxID=1735272 RepID=UPI001B887A74|nr:SREBP regulating gene protein-like [Gigantopelta aegis]
MFITRVLRKRWVLSAIFIGSLLYFLVSVFSKSKDLVLDEYEVKQTLRKPFQWQPKVPDEPEKVGNDTKIFKCRNSVQGIHLIADERGYVCKREDLGPGNCCNVRATSSKRYHCESCMSNKCCAVYEYCISCCLQPDKQTLLSRILKEASNEPFNPFAFVEDHFELCLLKCRTSSQSVQHENSYRDPKAKYCYGENPPDLQAVLN